MNEPRKPSPQRLWVTRRNFVKVGGLGLLGTIVAACGGGQAGVTTTTAGATTTTGGATTTTGAGTTTTAAGGPMANLSSLQIGEFNPNYAAQWSVMLADALGYNDEFGIEEIEMVVSDEYIAGLIGNSLDISHVDTDVILGSAAASGEPLKIINCYREKEWWIMGVAPGIETAEDLRGGSVTGGQFGSRNDFVQRQILRELGLDPETDVQMVPTSGGSDGRLQALLAGTVQGASVFPRHEAALEEAGGKFLYAELNEAPQECYAAMGGWLEENADTAQAWVLADLRARQWLFDRANKDQAYEMMRDLGYEIPPEFVEQYEIELEQISPDGGFDADAMDKFVSELIEIGVLPEGLEWRDHVELSFLWNAQEELGLPLRPDPAQVEQ